MFLWYVEFFILIKINILKIKLNNYYSKKIKKLNNYLDFKIKYINTATKYIKLFYKKTIESVLHNKKLF